MTCHCFFQRAHSVPVQAGVCHHVWPCGHRPWPYGLQSANMFGIGKSTVGKRVQEVSVTMQQVLALWFTHLINLSAPSGGLLHWLHLMRVAAEALICPSCGIYELQQSVSTPTTLRPPGCTAAPQGANIASTSGKAPRNLSFTLTIIFATCKRKDLDTTSTTYEFLFSALRLFSDLLVSVV